MANTEWLEYIRNNAEDVSTLDDHEISQLEKMLGEFDAKNKADINANTPVIFATSGGSTDLSFRKRNAINDALQQNLKQFMDNYKHQLLGSITNHAKLGAEPMQKLFDTAGMSNPNDLSLAVQSNLFRVPIEAATATLKRFMRTGIKLSDTVWNMEANGGKDIKKAVLEMTVLGKPASSQEIISQMEQMINPKWQGVMTTLHGQKVSFAAARVLRTERTVAFREAQNKAINQTPLVKGVKWVRGSACNCDICAFMANNDGYGLGAGVYPVGYMPYHPHPQCMCYTYAVFDGTMEDYAKRWKKFMDNPAEDKKLCDWFMNSYNGQKPPNFVRRIKYASKKRNWPAYDKSVKTKYDRMQRAAADKFLQEQASLISDRRIARQLASQQRAEARVAAKRAARKIINDKAIAAANRVKRTDDIVGFDDRGNVVIMNKEGVIVFRADSMGTLKQIKVSDLKQTDIINRARREASWLANTGDQIIERQGKLEILDSDGNLKYFMKPNGVMVKFEGWKPPVQRSMNSTDENIAFCKAQAKVLQKHGEHIVVENGKVFLIDDATGAAVAQQMANGNMQRFTYAGQPPIHVAVPDARIPAYNQAKAMLKTGDVIRIQHGQVLIYDQNGTLKYFEDKGATTGRMVKASFGVHTPAGAITPAQIIPADGTVSQIARPQAAPFNLASLTPVQRIAFDKAQTMAQSGEQIVKVGSKIFIIDTNGVIQFKQIAGGRLSFVGMEGKRLTTTQLRTLTHIAIAPHTAGGQLQFGGMPASVGGTGKYGSLSKSGLTEVVPVGTVLKPVTRSNPNAGISDSLIGTMDGKTYFIKANVAGSYCNTGNLEAELLASEMMDKVGLKTPRYVYGDFDINGNVSDWVASELYADMKDYRKWQDEGHSYSELPKDKWRLAAAFDALIGNSDRHYGNIKVNNVDFSPVLVDHNLAFGTANNMDEDSFFQVFKQEIDGSDSSDIFQRNNTYTPILDESSDSEILSTVSYLQSSYTDEYIEDVVEELPDRLADRDRKDELIETLKWRRDNLYDIIKSRSNY